MSRLKEMTAHIRNRVAKAGIKARVRMAPGGGSIQVFVPQYGLEFSESEQREIRLIAQVNKLTLVRGMPIVLDQMTDPHQLDFYLPAVQT